MTTAKRELFENVERLGKLPTEGIGLDFRGEGGHLFGSDLPVAVLQVGMAGSSVTTKATPVYLWTVPSQVPTCNPHLHLAKQSLAIFSWSYCRFQPAPWGTSEYGDRR